MHQKSRKSFQRRDTYEIANLLNAIKLNPTIFIWGLLLGFTWGFLLTDSFSKVPILENVLQQLESTNLQE
ncbi:MAG: hypothetical protein LDL41_08975 [Coleofasciculus sp. S288]|nr:hypothetical protein [Coleofasciculus sp. S288]